MTLGLISAWVFLTGATPAAALYVTSIDLSFRDTARTTIDVPLEGEGELRVSFDSVGLRRASLGGLALLFDVDESGVLPRLDFRTYRLLGGGLSPILSDTSLNQGFGNVRVSNVLVEYMNLPGLIEPNGAVRPELALVDISGERAIADFEEIRRQLDLDMLQIRSAAYTLPSFSVLVPEPGTGFLLGAGLAALARRRRSRSLP